MVISLYISDCVDLACYNTIHCVVFDACIPSTRLLRTPIYSARKSSLHSCFRFCLRHADIFRYYSRAYSHIFRTHCILGILKTLAQSIFRLFGIFIITY